MIIKHKTTGEVLFTGNIKNLQEADLRRADLEGVDLRGVDLKEADLRGAYLQRANLERADLEGADLRWADLREADLQGVDLRGANLRGAYLQRADLRGAYLEGAYLEGAGISFTEVKSFVLGRHFGFFHNGYLKIGCQGYSLEYWLNNYRRIGVINQYTKEQIRLYGAMIKLLHEQSDKE